MKKRYYVLILLLLVFIALSVGQYMRFNRQQRIETTEFIRKQIILCGKSIEDASLAFEESVKFEFANRELKYFFNTEPYKLDSEIYSNYIETQIKRIRRFYSHNQVLISRITIFNDSVYRSFERDNNNYFNVTSPQNFLQKRTLKSHPSFGEQDSLLIYTQPVTNARGELIANVCFELKISNFLSYHFEKFYIGKNSWHWAIDHKGQVLFYKYSESIEADKFETDVLDKFRVKLNENITTSLQHTIRNSSEINAYSVFYPVNILGKNFGIVFSVNTDTLYQSQNESNLAIFIYFLLLIACIIVLFSIIIKQMVRVQKRLESSDALLRTANQASEILLTDPDFDRSMQNFLEITAKASGYHRAYIIESQQDDKNDIFQLKYEWCDLSFIKPISVEIPETLTGFETGVFRKIITDLRQNKLIKKNEYECPESFKPIMAKLQCKAFIGMPVYVDDSMYGIVGFMDCVGARRWQDFEDALFANFANAVGGALSIQKKKEELIKAKEKAEESDRLKSAFLANMSHEIRTPMNGILGFTELLKEPDLTEAQHVRYLNIIEKSGDRMLNTINDIIDFSKIEAGLMEVAISETNVNNQIEDIYTFFKPEAEEKGLRFSFNNSLPENEVTISTDAKKLYAILTNLVKNAIKFTPGGSVEFGYVSTNPTTQVSTGSTSQVSTGSTSQVSAGSTSQVSAGSTSQVSTGSTSQVSAGLSAYDSQAGSTSEIKSKVGERGWPSEAETSRNAELKFYVKDTGIGIPQSRLNAIFERFVQADISDKRAFQGSGLGLTISKAYVEMLGGKIWVESQEENPETGVSGRTAFYFTIPFTKVQGQTENMSKPNSEEENYAEPVFDGQGLKILIAEDEEVSNLMLAIVLKNICREILYAQTGFEAIDVCRKHPDLDLVLMDIKMPDMNGYEATRIIRTFNSRVVIVAQTAYALHGDREKALEAGCDDYITKPISRTILFEKIKRSGLMSKG